MTEDDYSFALENAFTNPVNLGIDLSSGAYNALAGQSNQNFYTPSFGTQGTDNDQLVLRYPKQRIEASADYLSITIFDYESNSDIFDLSKKEGGKSLSDLLGSL